MVIGEILAGQQHGDGAAESKNLTFGQMRILVDRSFIGSLDMREGDAPYLISPEAKLLNDDERAQ